MKMTMMPDRAGTFPQIRLVSLLAALASLTLALVAAAPAQAHPNDVLPDLDQIVPTDLMVKSQMVGPHRVWRLGFASAAANVGAGPLTLHGYRRSRKVTTMR